MKKPRVCRIIPTPSMSRKNTIFALLAIIGIFGLFGAFITRSKPMPDRPFLHSEHPLNIAHRGASRLAPENTLKSFETALDSGADVLELDVHLTREGETVVCHDARVDRTTDGHGLIEETSFEDLRALDAGYHFTPDHGQTYPYRGQGIRIPAFREVLERFPDTRVNVELKTPDFALAEAVWEIIQNTGAQERIVVASFHHEALCHFRSISAGSVVTSASPNEVKTFYTLLKLGLAGWYRPNFYAFQVPEYHDKLQVVTPRFIRMAHAKNIHIHVYDADDRETMQRLLSMGVDGIITDLPDLFTETLERIHSLPDAG
ncbi:MAG: glycerophosphodiester phosphodiesterase [bacterium]